MFVSWFNCGMGEIEDRLSLLQIAIAVMMVDGGAQAGEMKILPSFLFVCSIEFQDLTKQNIKVDVTL